MTTSVLYLILCALPLVFAVVACFSITTKASRDEALLKRVFKNSSKSLIDVQTENLEQKTAVKKKNFLRKIIDKQNARFSLVGLNYKYETVVLVALGVFVASALLSGVLFKAGPLLMLYLGIVFGGIVLVTVNHKADDKKDELTVEFLEKINELSAHISVGKTIPNAIDEIINTGQISAPLAHEFALAKQEILLGRPMSDAFMKMYNTLQIDEIRTFASTLSVYEETGGNIIEVLKANDNFFQNQLKIRNTQKVYISSLKTTQKLTILIPVGFMVAIFIINPSFFGEYYASPLGQMVGIIAISVLLFGVFISNRIATLK